MSGSGTRKPPGSAASLDTDLVDVVMAVQEQRLGELADPLETTKCLYGGHVFGRGIRVLLNADFPSPVWTKSKMPSYSMPVQAVENDRIVTSGGRVLGSRLLVIPWKRRSPKAYREVEKIDFKDKHFRHVYRAKASRYVHA